MIVRVEGVAEAQGDLELARPSFLGYVCIKMSPTMHSGAFVPLPLPLTPTVPRTVAVVRADTDDARTCLWGSP